MAPLNSCSTPVLLMYQILQEILYNSVYLLATYRTGFSLFFKLFCATNTTYLVTSITMNNAAITRFLLTNIASVPPISHASLLNVVTCCCTVRDYQNVNIKKYDVFQRFDKAQLVSHYLGFSIAELKKKSFNRKRCTYPILDLFAQCYFLMKLVQRLIYTQKKNKVKSQYKILLHSQVNFNWIIHTNVVFIHSIASILHTISL